MVVQMDLHQFLLLAELRDTPTLGHLLAVRLLLQQDLRQMGLLGAQTGKAAGQAGQQAEQGFRKANAAAKDFNGTIQNSTMPPIGMTTMTNQATPIALMMPAK